MTTPKPIPTKDIKDFVGFQVPSADPDAPCSRDCLDNLQGIVHTAKACTQCHTRLCMVKEPHRIDDHLCTRCGMTNHNVETCRRRALYCNRCGLETHDTNKCKFDKVFCKICPTHDGEYENSHATLACPRICRDKECTLTEFVKYHEDTNPKCIVQRKREIEQQKQEQEIFAKKLEKEKQAKNRRIAAEKAEREAKRQVKPAPTVTSIDTSSVHPNDDVVDVDVDVQSQSSQAPSTVGVSHNSKYPARQIVPVVKPANQETVTLTIEQFMKIISFVSDDSTAEKCVGLVKSMIISQ